MARLPRAVNVLLVVFTLTALAAGFANDSLEVLLGDEGEEVADPLQLSTCKLDPAFFENNNVTYTFGLTSDCTLFVFRTTDEAAWKKLFNIIKTQDPAIHRCFGSDFEVSLSVETGANDPKAFAIVLDKGYSIIQKIPLSLNLPLFQTLKFDHLSSGLFFRRRKSEEAYKNYAVSIASGMNVFSSVVLVNDIFRIHLTVRNARGLSVTCLESFKSEVLAVPLFINFVSQADWYSSFLEYHSGSMVIPDSVPIVGGMHPITVFWIICVFFTVLAVTTAVAFGIVCNRTKKAQLKLEVAVEALVASTCTNTDHQLRRSALLAQCGYPSVETADITTTTVLLDENTGYTASEYEAYAEQIRRVQMAPTDESLVENKSESKKTTTR